MKIKTTLTIGNSSYEFNFDENKEMEAFHKAIVLSNPPEYCNICKNTENFKFDSNKDKEGNIYINFCCQNIKCFAKAKLGQYKAGGYFWHKFEQWKKPDSYHKNNSESSGNFNSMSELDNIENEW